MALTIGKTMIIVNFFITFKSYFVEVFPALALGLLASGIIHEFIPAFINQGMNTGAGLSLLILGPIVSYGTILVLRKEFGFKTLLIFLVSVSSLSLLTGFLFTLI